MLRRIAVAYARCVRCLVIILSFFERQSAICFFLFPFCVISFISQTLPGDPRASQHVGHLKTAGILKWDVPFRIYSGAEEPFARLSSGAYVFFLRRVTTETQMRLIQTRAILGEFTEIRTGCAREFSHKTSQTENAN